MTDKSDEQKLEGMMGDLIDTLTAQVKTKDCPASVLNVARQLLKDQGIEARRTKKSPLGNLAESLPTFDKDAGEDDQISYN